MDGADPMSRSKPPSHFTPRSLRALRAKAMRRPEDFAATFPVTTLEGLAAAKIKSGDPYALRRTKKITPKVALQLEYDMETALYAALDSNELSRYAEALRRCWSLLGIAKGDRVGIFDYGTSPVSYLASSTFTPYLQRGAADILGCLPICNDGAANLSQRAVEIVKFVRPRVMFLRTDCLHPFTAEISRGSMPLSSYVDTLVAVENEGVLARAERDAYQAKLGVPIYRLMRADAAMFLAPECHRCGLFHLWSDLYHVEAPEPQTDRETGRQASRLVITNWFATSCPTIRYVSQISACLQPPGCPADARDLRISA